jgi:hypothetical protein
MREMSMVTEWHGLFGAGEKVRQWKPFRRKGEKRLRILDAATL